MKKVVFTTWGSYGDLHPYMALARELQERGHHCVIATSPIYREKVEAAGLDFRPVRPDLPPPDSELAGEMIRELSHWRRGPEYLFRGLLMPALTESYADTLSAVEGCGSSRLAPGTTHCPPRCGKNGDQVDLVCALSDRLRFRI